MSKCNTDDQATQHPCVDMKRQQLPGFTNSCLQFIDMRNQQIGFSFEQIHRKEINAALCRNDSYSETPKNLAFHLHYSLFVTCPPSFALPTGFSTHNLSLLASLSDQIKFISCTSVQYFCTPVCNKVQSSIPLVMLIWGQ